MADDKIYRILAKGESSLADYNSAVTKTITITPRTTVPITIRERSGVSYIIPPVMQGGVVPNTVEIIISISVADYVNINIPDTSMCTLTPELQLLHTALAGSGEPIGVGRHVYRFVYTYPLSYFKEHGLEFYHPIADVVLSVLPIGETSQHPGSLLDKVAAASEELLNDYQGLTVYAVRLVDSNNVLGSRYTNISGDVFLINPVEDGEINIPNGLYIIGDKPILSGKGKLKGGEGGRSTFIPMAELVKSPEKYNLYMTRGEARSRGDKQLESTLNALEDAKRKEEKLQWQLNDMKRKMEEAKGTNQKHSTDMKWLMEIPKLLISITNWVKLLK